MSKHKSMDVGDNVILLLPQALYGNVLTFHDTSNGPIVTVQTPITRAMCRAQFRSAARTV